MRRRLLINRVGPGGFSGWSGVSFTTPSGGPWTNIEFNFFGVGNGNTTPTALGTAYILTQVYTLPPDQLTGTTAGFVASSTSLSGGEYIFDTSAELLPNTEYWVYENASVSVGYGLSSVGGLTWYATNSDNVTGFSAQSSSQAGFDLTGTDAAPEPAGAGLALAGLSGLAIIARRRKLEVRSQRPAFEGLAHKTNSACKERAPRGGCGRVS